MNAHVQSQILEVGMTLQLCASILRLFEIFDFEHVKQEQITRIRSLAETIVVSASSSSRSMTAVVDEIAVQPQIDIDSLETKTPAMRGNNETKKSGGESDYSSSEEEIPLNGSINSVELRRQKLEIIKTNLILQLKEDGQDFDRKDLVLYGSNLTDILFYQPKVIDEIREVLSVQFLISKNREFVELQLKKVGPEIVKVFS